MNYIHAILKTAWEHDMSLEALLWLARSSGCSFSEAVAQEEIARQSDIASLPVHEVATFLSTFDDAHRQLLRLQARVKEDREEERFENQDG